VSETARLSKRGNLEQNARNRRYEFLESVADREKAFAVLTGHTMDDQAETILMNLIRGCGPDGLSGMQAHRGRIVRPLLRWCRRRQTEEFCRAKNVDFRQDRMNDDASFRRVQIRREIIPLLAGMNPRIVETLCASAELIRPAAPVAPANDMLSIAELKALRQVERLTAIRCWLEHHRGNTRQLGLKHIQAVERLALSEKSGRAVELPGKATVNRSSGRLSYKKDKVDKSAHDN
jgi:tRNA(Ile)-lysidine synthase